MTPSNFQAPSDFQVLKCTLIPGFAESVRRKAGIEGDHSIKQIANKMIQTRNWLYCGIALNAIGVAGVAISEQSIAAITTLGVGLLLTTTAFQQVIDVVDLFQYTTELRNA